MSAVTDYAIARNIRSAYGYINAAAELDSAILPDDGSKVLRFDPDFVPSKEWIDATKQCYYALSSTLESLVEADDELYAWISALADRGKYLRFGWEHRVILTMLAMRTNNNDDDCDFGDNEFHLVMKAIKGEFDT